MILDRLGPLLCLTLCFFACTSPPAEAAAPELQKDADYDFQGEYVNRRSGWGLQVVAKGHGTFQAALLSGGLPGYGADGGSRTELNGERQGELLELRTERGDRIQITQGRQARVYWSNSQTACLRKIHRQSPTLGAAPPACSIILFNGCHTRAFKNATMNSRRWLEVGTELIPKFRDFTLHVEFLVPYMPADDSQKRGNSGIYLQSRYEVQVLDSFGSTGEFNECGSLYRLRAPNVNMCLPPLRWQTYDINFRSARFNEAGDKLEDARITVRHNGVTIHNHQPIPRKTGAGKPESAEMLPIRFQDHNDPVHFRNIWIVPHDRAYLHDLPIALQYAPSRSRLFPRLRRTSFLR